MALFTKDPPPSRVPGRTEQSPTAGPAGPTFIGPNVAFEGTLTGSEPIVVEGSIKGNINLNANLHVGKKARIEATVHAKNVTVEGKLTGDISADERVELVQSAEVDGNIKAPKIVVAEGARFRGAVDMGSARPKEQPEPQKAK